MIPWRILLISGIMTAFAGPGFADGDPAKGQTVFKKCMACHRVGEDARNLVGPVLNNLIGRQAGTVSDYRYSELNRTAGESGLVWTEELIFEYLPDPQAFLVGFLEEQGKGDLAKGRTKMVFKLRPEQERLDVIAYLKQFSPPGQ